MQWEPSGRKDHVYTGVFRSSQPTSSYRKPLKMLREAKEGMKTRVESPWKTGRTPLRLKAVTTPPCDSRQMSRLLERAE